MTPSIELATVRNLDHHWFPFRTTAEATVPAKDCKLVVSLVIVLQHFTIDARAPFPLSGAPDRPYPDFGNFTQRESGLGHALWRLTDAIDALAIPASFVVERLALPYLADVKEVLQHLRHCIVAGGEHAVCVHTRDMGRDIERRVIADCLQGIEAYLDRKAQGWRSPYCSQSPVTLELLAEAGLRYVGDFANDDRPFKIVTESNSLIAVPMNHFYSDLHFIHGCRQSVNDYAQATISAAEALVMENHATPAVLSLVIHPWIMGVTHRAAPFSTMLATLQAIPGVQFMNSDEIYMSSLTTA
jgi:allantoinase